MTPAQMATFAFWWTLMSIGIGLVLGKFIAVGMGTDYDSDDPERDELDGREQ